MEEVGKLQGKLKELKQSKEAAFEAKAMLEDELQSMKHKIAILSKMVESYCTREILAGEKWRIVSYSLSPIFTDTPKMYLTYALTVVYSPNFSSPTAFTCMVCQDFPLPNIILLFSVYGIIMWYYNLHVCICLSVCLSVFAYVYECIYVQHGNDMFLTDVVQEENASLKAQAETLMTVSIKTLVMYFSRCLWIYPLSG